MSQSGTFLVYFNRGACDLEGAQRSLASRRLTVSRRSDSSGEYLAVSYPGSTDFRIYLSDAAHVILEAAETAARAANRETLSASKLKDLSECSSRFDVIAADLDQAVGEMTTLMIVQEILQGVSNGFLFICWSNRVIAP